MQSEIERGNWIVCGGSIGQCVARMNRNTGAFLSMNVLILAGAIAGGIVLAGQCAQAASSKLVYLNRENHLSYAPYTERGDTIPDFSECGYRGGGVELPRVPVRLTLEPQPGSEHKDDTLRIQEAIDKLSAGQPDANGHRGAVLLKKGAYYINGSLGISAGGVVLRGEGQATNGTVLYATGTRRRNLVVIGGLKAPAAVSGTIQKVTSSYVPVGARSLEVQNASGFKPGDLILVTRNGNKEWIHEIGMDAIVPRASDPSSTRQWQPFNMSFERKIVTIEGNGITIDVPTVLSIDERWGGGSVALCEDKGRIEECGLEDLRADSAFDPEPKAKSNGREHFVDEEHATQLVQFTNVKNSWARNLTAVHFYHGVSSIDGGAKWITVTDCSSLEPVSQITGGRRYPFSINGGQLCLVQRCYSDGGRHAFVFGSRVPGPNVFLQCKSERDYATSEPHHRWSVGGLYDNVVAQIAFQDRGSMGTGHGWAGANYVAWNCEGTLVCQQPPTAQNFAIGFVGKREPGAYKRPSGWWESEGAHVEPRSLYLQQLKDRLGKQGAIQ